MNIETKNCFVIFRNDDSGAFPMYKTKEHKIALMAFKSRLSAEHFVHNKQMNVEWKIVEFEQQVFVQWLRDAYKTSGATEIAFDPNPASMCDDVKVIPILNLLIEIE